MAIPPEREADLGGYYARDTHRGGYGDDYARESFRGRGPKGYRRSDERILEDVVQRLTDAHEVDATDIDVAVTESTVTLSGSVSTRREKALAEQIAEGCRDVRDVFNNLRVRR